MDNGRANSRGEHAAEGSKGEPTREHDAFAEAIAATMRPSAEQLKARDHRLARKLNRMTPDQRLAHLERREKWERRGDVVFDHPAWLTGATFAVAVILILAVQLFTTEPVILGVALIVLIGGAGLMLRGFGELRGSTTLKAWGYFLGALAYVVTAGVALLNGARLLQP